MNDKAVRFSDMEWNQVGEFARQKAANFAGQRVRMLELLPGFEEEQWCNRGHVGLVLEGTLEIEFNDGVQQYHPGDALTLPNGQEHKAKRTEQTVKLFLVDEE